MKNVLITTKNNFLGERLAKTYKTNNGPIFNFIIVIPESKKSRYNPIIKIYFALKIFGLTDSFRVLLNKFITYPLFNNKYVNLKKN